jgi:hypothetical protein
MVKMESNFENQGILYLAHLILIQQSIPKVVILHFHELFNNTKYLLKYYFYQIVSDKRKEHKTNRAGKTCYNICIKKIVKIWKSFGIGCRVWWTRYVIRDTLP